MPTPVAVTFAAALTSTNGALSSAQSDRPEGFAPGDATLATCGDDGNPLITGTVEAADVPEFITWLTDTFVTPDENEDTLATAWVAAVAAAAADLVDALADRPAVYEHGGRTLATIDDAGQCVLTVPDQLSTTDAVALAAWITTNCGS
jgi:hypothetical protein